MASTGQTWPSYGNSAVIPSIAGMTLGTSNPGGGSNTVYEKWREPERWFFFADSDVGAAMQVWATGEHIAFAEVSVTGSDHLATVATWDVDLAEYVFEPGQFFARAAEAKIHGLLTALSAPWGEWLVVGFDGSEDGDASVPVVWRGPPSEVTRLA